MTKAEFDAAMVRGWEHRAYLTRQLFDDAWTGTACCAMGAAILGTMPANATILDDNGDVTDAYRAADRQVRDMPLRTMDRIIDASNAAGSKEAAIAAVTALRW